MKNYFKAIAGGFIFGLLATIPFILIYVYKGWILSLLTCLIAMWVKFGYKKFGGVVDSKTPIVISILSIFIVIFLMLVFIPLLMLYKQGFIVNFSNLIYLYQLNEFWVDTGYTLTLSFIFTLFGIILVVKSLKKEMNNDISDIIS